MTVSHQLVLVLKSVLEQGPYDGLQLWVRGQQVGAEQLQPCVGQAVHCREGTWFVHATVTVQISSGETEYIEFLLLKTSAPQRKINVYEQLTFLIEETERVGLGEPRSLTGWLCRRLRGSLRAGCGRRVRGQDAKAWTYGGQISVKT